MFMGNKASSSGAIKPPKPDELLEHYTVEQLRMHFLGLSVGNTSSSFTPKAFDPDAKPEDIDPRNDTLWKLWRVMKYEVITHEKEMKKRFSGMQHGQIETEDGEYLYLKWQESGVWRAFELDDETMTARVDAFDSWDYPKSNKIGKQTREKMERKIIEHFAGLGYTVKFVEPLDNEENQ